MSMLRRHVSSWHILAVAFLCLATISMAASCTKNERLTTIHASVLSVGAAWDEFVVWDLEHERKLLAESTTREEVDKKIAAYEKLRHPVEVARALAYQELSIAATQSDSPSLTRAAKAVQNLVDAIAKLRADTEGT